MSESRCATCGSWVWIKKRICWWLRAAFRESTALSRRLLRFIDHDVSAVRSRNAALNHQQILFFIHTQDPQVAHRYPDIAHVARHPHALEHARWKRRRTDRTRNLKHRTVRLRTTRKVMPLHYTLKPAPLAHSDDVHKPFAFENIHQHPVSNFYHALGRLAVSVDFHVDFAQKLHRRQVVLGKVPPHRLGSILFLSHFHHADLRRLA